MKVATVAQRAALLKAAKKNDVKALGKLLDGGLDVDTRLNEERQTALMHAAAYGHPEAVKLLLARGAAVERADRYGWTPLLHAVRGRRNSANAEIPRRMRTARMLLAAGADPNAADTERRTVLWAACGVARGRSTAANTFVSHLLKLGPDLLAKDRDRYSILHMAAYTGNVEVARACILAGADVNEKFRGGVRTAIALATERPGNKVAKVLLTAGANPNVYYDGPADSPLACACYHRDYALIKLLRAHGADPKWVIRNFVPRLGAKAQKVMLAALGG